MTERAAGNNNDPPAAVESNKSNFQRTDSKLCIALVTLSKENDQKRLEQLKSGFIRTVKCNKYRSPLTVHSNNNNLSYLVDPACTKVNRLFVLSFERIEEDNVIKDHRDSFSRYYVPNVEMKDFNFLIDGKSFFDLPVENEEEAYEKIIEMRSNDYTTGILLDFAYFKEYYRLIAIDLSKESKLKDPQLINFICKREKQANGVTMFLIIEKSEESTFEFLQKSLNIF